MYISHDYFWKAIRGSNNDSYIAKIKIKNVFFDKLIKKMQINTIYILFYTYQYITTFCIVSTLCTLYSNGGNLFNVCVKLYFLKKTKQNNEIKLFFSLPFFNHV